MDNELSKEIIALVKIAYESRISKEGFIKFLKEKSKGKNKDISSSAALRVDKLNPYIWVFLYTFYIKEKANHHVRWPASVKKYDYKGKWTQQINLSLFIQFPFNKKFYL